MRKFIHIICFIIIWGSAFSQDFPPPRHLFYNWGFDTIHMFWLPPENKSLSHYNIYHYGYINGKRIFIGSTTQTDIIIPSPAFAFWISFGVTAVYFNPPGESDTIWLTCVWDANMFLPFLIDFEDPWVNRSGLVGSIWEGTENWELSDSIFYSPGHSAAFISALCGSRASLITNWIDLDASQTTTLSLSMRCRIPQNKGHSDTLKLFYKNFLTWIPLSDPIYSMEDWQLLTYTFDSLPAFFNFAFEATSGGGCGVFLDDILFENASVHIQDQQVNKSILEINPNPATSSLHLKINIEENTEFDVTVYSIEGLQVKSNIPQMLMPGNHKTNIDISDLNPGLYFVSAKLNNHFVRKKFIKQ